MFGLKSASRFAFSALCAGAVLAATPASACNLLQKLIGACEQPQQAAPPPPTLEAILPPEKKGEKRPTVAAMPKKQVPLAPPEGAAVGSLAHFSGDPTLRKGDIVVTRSGFLVFNGAPTGDKAVAFGPIDPKNGQLAELQSESRKSDWTASIASAPSALAARSALEKAADAKAKKRPARKIAAAGSAPGAM